MKAKPKTTKKPVAKKAAMPTCNPYDAPQDPIAEAYWNATCRANLDAELAKAVALIKKEDALLAAETLPAEERDAAISTIVREYDADMDRANRAEQYARAKAYVAMRAAQDAAK